MSELFSDAARHVQRAASDKNFKLTSDQQLALYGAYKQATEGDCTTSK
jgi:acyl-CoA-binding protein